MYSCILFFLIRVYIHGVFLNAIILYLTCFLAKSWGTGSRGVDSSMFGRAEETFRKYKRPEGHDFMKEAKSVGVPICSDSSSYRFAFSESKLDSGAPAKKQKSLSGQPVESFEFKLARSVRRLSMYI